MDRIREIAHKPRDFLTNKRVIKYGIMLSIIFAVTLFIFGNSFADYDRSHSTSDRVSEMILPDKYVGNEDILLIIRKAAHLAEYALLGCAVMIVVLKACDDLGKKYYATALFYVLAVAVLDEYIQSFSDRTSSTGDVILDFFGSLIGFFAGWIIIRVFAAIKQHYKNKISPEAKNNG